MHRSKHPSATHHSILALSALLLPVLLALPVTSQATGSCNSNSCSGHADAIITSVKMDSTTGDVMLNIAAAARTSITSCTLATGGYARINRNHLAFASLYPTLLQAIATGQWIGIAFQSGSGCYVSGFSAVSTQISSPATGGGGGGGGDCSMYGCTQ